ncbi:hypothetical protein HGRIS_004203 [Hohenbuehelia grisea]
MIPKAQYPGWINFVKEAEIEVHGVEAEAEAETDAAKGILFGRSRPMPFGRRLDQHSNEIRLILLNAGATDELVSCTLIDVSLSNPQHTPYEALSYCWGDPRRRSDIIVHVPSPNGTSEHSMSVTSSLHSALKRLRPQTGPPRALWVDAICINQNDLSERSGQVSLMRRIYVKAERVVVWLGPGDEASTYSIRTINSIQERFDAMAPADRVNLIQDALTASHDPLMEGSGVDRFIDQWPLFEAPWFRRTWVVQEVLNARSALICCGDETLDWTSILRVNACILRCQLKMNSAYKALMPPIYELLFNSRLEKEDGWFTNVGILDVLIKGLDLDAAEPKDKLFAMLQFGHETADIGSLPPSLAPDYNKSITSIFSDFTRWLIVEHKSLRILSAIQSLYGRTWQETYFTTSARSDEDRPSWSWWYQGHSTWAIGCLGITEDCSYRASAGTQPDISLIQTYDDPSLLVLTGVCIDTIETIQSYPYYTPHEPSGEELHRAYIGIFDPLNFTGKWTHQFGSKHMDSYTTNESPNEKSFHFNAHEDFSKRTGGVECHSECYFRLPDGTKGLCPFSARPGDLIVILHGGNVPYVLRRCGITADNPESAPRYTYIGECYLQGYMNGRAIVEQKEKNASTETFILV